MKFSPLPVCELLRGKRILITGASGFLAKVFLEKLLRDVPEIERITLLLRPSQSNPDVSLRLVNEILGSSIFERIRAGSKNAFPLPYSKKIECLEGEQTAPFLGLDPCSFEKLGEQTDLVINIAASVNFGETIDQMLLINSISLKTLSALAAIRKIPFIHISTCYVNSHGRGRIPEQILAPAHFALPFNVRGYYEVEDLITSLQEQINRLRDLAEDENALRKKLLQFGNRQARNFGWTDCYTFTKWLGEQLAIKLAGQGRLTILRPAIIESTLQEPVPGWIEGVKVLDTVSVAYARGKLAGMPYRPDGVVDIIPADLVANSMVLAAADIFRRSPGVQILQCCSGSRSPISLQQMVDFLNQEIHGNWEAYRNFGERRPPQRFQRPNTLVFWSSLCIRRLFYQACAALNAGLNILPVAAAVKRFESMYSLVKMHYAYGQPAYVFDNTKMMELADRFSAEDRSKFAVDPAAIDWQTYFQEHFRGLDKYVLRPPRNANGMPARREKKVSAVPSA